jgi:hypothetical protein
MDERLLSELLREAVPEGDRALMYMKMGEQPNAITRWIDRNPVPGPDKWPAIAEPLGLTLYEVGAAVAMDQWERRQAKHAR